MDVVKYFKSVNGVLQEIPKKQLKYEFTSHLDWKKHYELHMGERAEYSNHLFCRRAGFYDDEGRSIPRFEIEKIIRSCEDKRGLLRNDMDTLLDCLAVMEGRLMREYKIKHEYEMQKKWREKNHEYIAQQKERMMEDKRKRRQQAHLARLGFLFANPNTITRQLDTAVTKLETKTKESI